MYRVDIQERTLHFKQPAGTSRGVYTERHSWFVTITDGQHSGVGECAPLPNLSCDDIADYQQVLRRFCDQLELTQTIDYEAMRPYPSMLFGLETAMLNLRNGQRLFDTAFSRGEVGIPINGLVWMGSHDEMLARMQEKIAAGFRCVKLKIGAIGFEQEIDLISRIRSRFNHSQIEIRLDANGAFSPAEAMSKLLILSQFDVHSIEQPIRQNQWEAMADLCRRSPLPIALDEELIGVNTLQGKQDMIERLKPAYIVLKPSLHGGMHGCREWIEIAARNGVGTWITSALESNIGLNAIAQFCSSVYGDNIIFPQGLGTGQLFTDNIEMPLKIEEAKLWAK